MKIDSMDIYELLKEENQQFWDFLNVDLSTLDSLGMDMNSTYESYIVEEIESM